MCRSRALRVAVTLLFTVSTCLKVATCLSELICLSGLHSLLFPLCFFPYFSYSSPLSYFFIHILLAFQPVILLFASLFSLFSSLFTFSFLIHSVLISACYSVVISLSSRCISSLSAIRPLYHPFPLSLYLSLVPSFSRPPLFTLCFSPSSTFPPTLPICRLPSLGTTEKAGFLSPPPPRRAKTSKISEQLATRDRNVLGDVTLCYVPLLWAVLCSDGYILF